MSHATLYLCSLGSLFTFAGPVSLTVKESEPSVHHTVIVPGYFRFQCIFSCPLPSVDKLHKKV